jgi:hypothetical protein
MFYLRTTLQMLNANSSLLTYNTLRTKDYLRSDAMLLRNNLQNII